MDGKNTAKDGNCAPVVRVCDFLIVSGNAVARDLTAVILKGAGYSIAVTSDNAEALARMRAAEFKVVLVDMRLQGLLGPEVLGELRREDTRVVLMIMADEADKETLRTAQESKPAVVITRPFRGDALLETVHAMGFGARVAS
jgi:CheY-like chemotaxis protein